MPSINVGCPKCRSTHSLEVWGEGDVSETVDCSCGISFYVSISEEEEEEEQDNKKRVTCSQCDKKLLMQVIYVDDEDYETVFLCKCTNCKHENWVDAKGYNI